MGWTRAKHGACALLGLSVMGMPVAAAPERRSGSESQGVGGLPHAPRQRFHTLDDYLAHLRAYAAPMDRPWYREIRPGLFRLETGNLRTLSPTERLFTREQLERKFGFRR